ncbi:dihydrofolate reductase [Bacillus sp. RG28]|uniref:Dihydrofolate reductase n=1 Tax=Gottfriedia endophytica TaxID=2820819 RepID=A0A940NEM4_9BACI|nr:dihydrofolate reductase [Gottfriedia endophytica]MBP0724089.1 dihydrofolate reductase [Gottfriedia endophytica]
MIAAIVAMAENRVIGKDNQLPWHISEELRYFKKVTTGHTILMGRKTYESIGRPLPNRKNVVVTRNKDYKAEGIEVIHHLSDYHPEENEDVFIIGGAEIFKESMGILDTLYLTEIQKEIEGDTFFPEFSKEEWKEVSSSEMNTDEKSGLQYVYKIYKKIS